MVSNNGQVHVGVIACRESMPDADALVRHFPAELARLREAVAAAQAAATPITQARRRKHGPQSGHRVDRPGRRGRL